MRVNKRIEIKIFEALLVKTTITISLATIIVDCIFHYLLNNSESKADFVAVLTSCRYFIHLAFNN